MLLYVNVPSYLEHLDLMTFTKVYPPKWFFPPFSFDLALDCASRKCL